MQRRNHTQYNDPPCYVEHGGGGEHDHSEGIEDEAGPQGDVV